MSGFAERFINAYEAGGQAGNKRRVDETIQKFGTLASQGDEQAMSEIYGVDPGAAAQLETQFSNRNKSGAEWDQYVQEQAGRVAHSVLTAPAQERQQRVASGIDFMTGLTRRDPRFKPVIDGWRQKLQAGDMPGIESELNAVLERTMGFKDKYAGGNTQSTATERALAELYPDPKDRARALIQMETGKDKYIQTPNGMMVIPGRMPTGMPGASASDGTRPFAAFTGGQQPPAGPRPSSAPGYANEATGQAPGGPALPNGGYIIPGTEKPLDSGTKDEIREATKNVDNLNLSKGLLAQALKLNDSASSGPYLETRSGVGAQMGFQSSKDAQVMTNLLLRNVLPQLKASFGGSPTEGERAILIQIETAMEQPPDVRRQILETAQQLLDLRAENARRLIGGLQTGNLYRPSPQEADQPPAAETAPAPQGEPEAPPAGGPTPPPQASADPNSRLGPFRRGDVEAYAKKYGLTLEDAFRAQIEIKRRALQAKGGNNGQ